MPYTGRVANLKRSCNNIARHYGRRYQISTDAVHYGPLCPGDDKLHLLGDISGLCVLDLGCGGGPVEAGFEHYVRSVPHYCNALIDSGFTITRILEPKPTIRSPHRGFSNEIMREYPYVARHLPITFIIEAGKER